MWKINEGTSNEYDSLVIAVSISKQKLIDKLLETTIEFEDIYILPEDLEFFKPKENDSSSKPYWWISETRIEYIK